MTSPWDGRLGGQFISGGDIVSSPKHWITEESEEKGHKLGSLLRVGGNWYAYCKSSEALAAGKLCAAVADSDAEDTVTVAHPIGTTAITVTAATTITANQYEDGVLIVDEGTGAGNTYDIASNAAITSAATGVVNIYGGLAVAFAIADTDIVLCTSPYVVQLANTEQTETPICVPRIAVSSGYYFWGQVSGLVGLLQDEASGNNSAQRLLTIGSSVTGAVEAQDLAGEAVVGMRYFDAADDEDAKYQPAILTLPH